MSFCLNKSVFSKQDLHGFTEIFLLIPFLTKDVYYNELIPILGPHNEGLFTQLFYSGKHIIKESSIKDCNFSVLPFKFNLKDPRTNQILFDAKKNNKKVIAFYNDDNTENITTDTILFRTSLLLSKQKENEKVFPALVPDHFSKNYDCNSTGISFCGCLTQLRYSIIEQLKQIYNWCDFIIRSGFWAPEISCKIKARHEYNKNLLDNKYALCIRGAGNFSYRFYEALSYGRIPILIDTDTALPFSNIINWDKYIIFIKPNELQNLPNIIKDDTRSMTGNRKLWEEFFSVEGYTRNFLQELSL